MKVVDYYNNNGNILIKIANESEGLKFSNELFNNGNWKLFEYEKKENEESNKSYTVILSKNEINFLHKDYSRTIEFDSEGKVIKDYLCSDDDTYTSNYSGDLVIDHLNNQDVILKNNAGVIFEEENELSTVGLITFCSYEKFYGRILNEATSQISSLFKEANKKIVECIDERLEGNRKLYWPMGIVRYGIVPPYTAFTSHGFDTIEEAQDVIDKWKETPRLNVLCAYIHDDDQNIVYLENNVNTVGDIEYNNKPRQR